MSPVQWLVDQVNADCTNSTFIQQHLIDQALQMEMISDEEIKKEANEYAGDNVEWFICFLDGAEWYRENLKTQKQ